VQGATVVAPADGTRRRLVGFVVGTADPAEVVAFLRDRLPAYMVPADVRALDAFPLTGNGKVDRRALTAMAARHDVDDAVDETSAPLEHVLAGLYAEVLGVERVGATSDFFQLGGDSLAGTRLATRINDTFGVEVPRRTVLVHPTVAELARALAADPEVGDLVTDMAEALVGLTDDELAGLLAGAEPGR
jgi:acyl carrier protein